jgi:hypothetical protein
MTARRAAAGAVVVAALVAGLVALGRWEGDRATAEQRAGIERVRALVGDSLDGPRLHDYRLTPALDCLLYEAGGNPFGLELCFDGDARLVEAVDRRRRPAQIWDLTGEPSRAPRVDRAEVQRILTRLERS